jgi:hypothetical protein
MVLLLPESFVLSTKVILEVNTSCGYQNINTHMDVKTTFLNEDLKENVYMSQPKGFVVKRISSCLNQKDLL